MLELELQKILVFTPSRKIRGKRIVCHDDRYIVKLAVDTDGVIVSNDTYRDLVSECQEFRKAIEERLLMYSFVNDRLELGYFLCICWRNVLSKWTLSTKTLSVCDICSGIYAKHTGIARTGYGSQTTPIGDGKKFTRQ